MSILNRTKRVELDDGDWVDVRPLSFGTLRTMRQAAASAKPGPGEEKDEAQGYELSRLALEACIVDWSDEAPVTPENIASLPYAYVWKIAAEIGIGKQEAPLPTGQSSTESSMA